MKEIKCTLEGKTPLLLNKFTDAAQLQATSGNRAAQVGNRGTPTEIAESKLYIGQDGALVVPQPSLMRAIIDAGKYFKAGKSKVTTLKSSLIPACLDIAEIEIPIIHKQPWSVDSRPVRIPTTGGRIICHRPCFHDWSLSFSMELDEDVMTSGLLRDIVDAAGKRIGLGDFRPDCKGPFGKFLVTNWKERTQGQPGKVSRG